MKMKIAKISEKGQMAIPTSIREKIRKDNTGKREKEKIGWMILAEKSLKKLWNNKKDDDVWSKHQ